MELRDYLVVMRKYWRSVTAVALLTVLAAALLNYLSTPIYTSKTALFFSVNGGGTASELAQGTTFTGKQVESYVEVATSPLVLQPVIDELGVADRPEELVKRMTVAVPTDTAVIDIEVSDPSARMATAIADGIGRQLVETVRELSPSTVNGQEAVVATVIEPAAVANAPTSPKVAQNLALGLLAGLFLGVAQATLRNLLDVRVRTPEDVAHVTKAPLVGRIAFEKTLSTRPRLLDDRMSPRAEAFRRLRTNLQYLDPGKDGHSFVITSSVPNEGKTSTAIDTALTLAEGGLNVLLIDADMRKPSVASALGLEGSVGLSTVLIGRAQFQEVHQWVDSTTLHVLTAGEIPPNPAELLGSVAMTKLLDDVVHQYDVVVIDAPPLLPVTDAAILSRLTNGALLVVGSGDVKTPELSVAVESLLAVEGRILGVVLNKLPRRTGGYGGYYSYSYGEAVQAVESPAAVPKRGLPDPTPESVSL